MYLITDVSLKITTECCCRPPLFVPLAAGIEFLGSFIICAMYTGTTVCASIDAYELWTKFFLGCLFNCLGKALVTTAIRLQFDRATTILRCALSVCGLLHCGLNKL